MDINDFQTGIPISEMVTVNIFDPQVYDRFAHPDESSGSK